MIATMNVGVITPGWIETLRNVVRLRLEASDGSRGVLPGHETARVCLVPGPIEVAYADGMSRFLATEGGLAWIEADGVRIVSPWATLGDDLGSLRESVGVRGLFRSRMEQEARAVARRHELATQRALVALRRGVQP